MNLDPKKTACLTLDMQQGIFQILPGSESILPQAEKVIAFARKQGIPVIHVGLGFREGYPEVAPTAGFGAMLRQRNLFIKGTPSAEFAPSLVQPKDLIVYKHRVSGFTENDLHIILQSMGVETLILFGIATSGIVLSTLRRAFDYDYNCIVIKDACTDRDPEVHRVLTEKIFTSQATVIDANEFVKS